jgi:hypothetical protein
MNECCTPKGQVKRYVDCVGCDRKPKQETLEEAAEKESEYLADYEDKESYQKVFIEGAKSEAARYYWFEQFKKNGGDK